MAHTEKCHWSMRTWALESRGSLGLTTSQVHGVSSAHSREAGSNIRWGIINRHTMPTWAPHTHKQALKRLCFYTSRNIRKKENKQQIWRKKCQNMKMSPKWHLLAQVTYNAGEQGTHSFCLFFKNKNKELSRHFPDGGLKGQKPQKVTQQLRDKLQMKTTEIQKTCRMAKTRKTNNKWQPGLSHIPGKDAKCYTHCDTWWPPGTVTVHTVCSACILLSILSSKTTGILHADNVYSILFISFFEMVSLCSPGWPGLALTM